MALPTRLQKKKMALLFFTAGPAPYKNDMCHAQKEK